MASAFILMVMTAVQVLLRNFTTLSIPGVVELTEFAMVLIIFLSMGFLQSLKGHIRVEIFLDLFPRRVAHGFSFVAYLLSAVIIAIMFYAGIEAFENMRTSGQLTSIMRLVVWPFYAVASFGILLYAITLFVDSLIELIAMFGPEEAKGALGSSLQKAAEQAVNEAKEG